MRWCGGCGSARVLSPEHAPAQHGSDERVTVRVPTTVLWGEGDTALLPGLIDGLDRWVPDLRTVRVPDATHWIVHERPALVADGILCAIAR